ncbi:MAG: glycosyltransferase family 9 protein [Proteobacteria bacterium]|jgi:ADP-heptose:LPS heptosyltransferase|nr:glycosyltransferase family 9 protein [Pseudomonadota bacterium]
MKVDTMRKIDYYAGVPLCFVLTLWFGLVHVFSPAKRKTPRKVLLIELSEMGSAILVDPAMRKLQQHGAELYFLIFKKNAASLRLLGTVAEKNVFTIREDGLVPLATDTLRFLFWARRQGIDSVIDLELFSRFTALLTGLSGATNRVGFYAFHNEGLYRGELLTHRVAYNAHVHISKTFIALVNALLSKKDEHPYSKTLVSDDEIRLTKAEISATQQDAMRELVNRDYPGYTPNQHRIVLINPNASELLPQRRWMPERYVAVMQKILNNYLDVIILITGAPAERQEAEELKQQVNNERCVNFAGRLRLAELPVLYSIASLMLTNDSGPGHFSSITDLPTFVIFGPETPKLYGSLGNSTPIYAGLACSPCVSAANHRKTPCTDNVCLQVIEADEVYEKLKTVFDAGS